MGALFYEASNISEILILVMMVLANIFLAKSILSWNKEEVRQQVQNE